VRHRSVLLAGAVAFVVVASAFPANAADTTTTFDVSGGALTIAAPASATIGSAAAPGASISGSLGAVTVTDTRGTDPSPWTASVVATDFTNTTSTTTPAPVIPVADVSYWSGPATATTGDGTFTPGQATLGDAAALSATSLTAFSHTGGTGGNTAVWDPGLVISVPSTAQVGTYSGTVTHSVA
jgi:hypothetical protein